MSITKKLTLFLFTLIFIPFVLVTYLGYFYSKESITKEVENNLETYSIRKASHIDHYLKHIYKVIDFSSKNSILIATAQNILYHNNSNNKHLELQKNGLKKYLSSEILLHNLHDAYIISTEGDILFSLKQEDDYLTNLYTGRYKQSELASCFKDAKKGISLQITDFKPYQPSNNPAAFVCQSIVSQEKAIGVFAMQVSINSLYTIIQGKTGLSKTGETIIASHVNNRALFLNPLRHDKGAAFTQYVEIGSKDGVPIQEAVQGKSGLGIYTDYQGNEVLASWQYLDNLNVGLMVKINTDEAFERINNLKLYSFIMACITLVVLLYILYLFSKMVLKVERKREQYELAIDATKNGLWDWNLQTDTLYFSPNWKKQVGYRDDELSNEFSTWKSLIHPDDKEAAVSAYTANMNAQTKEYENIYRFKHKDGHWVWILNRGKTIFDENNKALRMLGFHTDITEQKAKEAKIEELSTLLNNILNSLDNLIFVKDINYVYIECNVAFEQFVGKSRDDIIGKTDYDIFDREIAGFFRGHDEKMLKKKTSRQNYEWVTYPDGRDVYLLTHKSPLLNSNNTIIGLVGNSVDLTQQQELQEELENSQKRFEQFMQYIPANILIKENEKIIYANEAANTFFNKKSIIGLTAEDVFSKELASKVNVFSEKTLKNGTHEEIIKTPNAYGEEKIYRNLSFKMSDKENESLKLLGIVSIDITNEYTAQLEISKLKSALERSPVSIVMTDTMGSIEYANENFIKSTGYTLDELIGKNPRILQSENTPSEVYTKMWEQISSGEVWSSTIQNRTKEGKLIWEDLTILPSIDEEEKITGYIAFKVEVTDKVSLKNRLLAEENRVKQLGEFLENSINEVYIFAQKDFKFLYCNKMAQENLGYTLEELKARTPLDIKPEMDEERFKQLLKPLLTKETNKITFSTLHQRKDTSTYPTDIYLQAIEYEAQEAYIAIVIDTTHREEIEKELHDNEELMLAQSRQAAMGEMIGMIAHQWRQPISVISMGINNIIADIDLEDVDAARFRKELIDITNQTQHLSKTIDDFRNFFKPNKEKDSVYISKVFNEALEVIGKSLDNNSISVDVQANDTSKVTLFSRELLQVFISLLNNSKEAFVGSEITIKNPSITCKIEQDTKNVHISLCDNAGGINEDIIDKIFNPYFSTKEAKQGTGLGLYMSKTIVEKHLFGSIRASNHNDGVCFNIQLPLQVSENE